MENQQQKRFNDLPNRVYFWENIAIIILSILAIILLWVGNLLNLWQLGLTFSILVGIGVLAYGITGIINSSKKIKKYALVYFIMFVLHIAFLIILAFYKTINWVGAILETIIFCAMLLFALYIIVEPHLSLEKGSNKIEEKVEKKQTVQQQNEQTIKEILSEMKKDEQKQNVNKTITKEPKPKNDDTIVNVTMK